MTVHRLELDQRSPRPGLPRTVILKQQKDGWEEEFQNEIHVYDRLKELQGAVIPRFLGQGSFNGLPALILSEVVGTTLYDFAHNNNPNINEEMT